MASRKTSIISNVKTCAGSAVDRLESLCGRYDEKYLLFAVLIAALVLRVSRAYFTPILNVDTAIYLFQAKALYYGQWQAINSCVLKSVSIHPIISSLLFALTHDWVVSLVATSILFGTLTTIPIYYTARLYFPVDISLLVALSYSVMYVFVTAGVDIGRDAPFWFFSACGIYFFSAGLKKDKTCFFPLSTVFFMLAAWNRIEAIMFLALTPLYLIFRKTNRKSLKIAGFFAPILFGIGIIFLMQALGLQIIHKFGEVQDMLPNALKSYHDLRTNLLSIIQSHPAGFEHEFFKQVRTLLWMLGVNIVVNGVAQSFLYLFFLIFLLGFFDFKKWRESSEAPYFAVLVSGSFLILYVFVLKHWFLENRYATLLILPSFVFLGFGIERVLSFFRRMLKVRQSATIFIFVCILLAYALPAQVKQDDKGKAVFKQIGTYIAEQENGSKSVNIMVVGAYFRILHLYSNLNSPDFSCPDDGDCSNCIGSNYSEFVHAVDRCKARYMVWEEKYWPADFDFMREYDRNDFLVVGEWYYEETGRIVLFKRLKSA